MKTSAKVISSEGLAEAEAEKSIKKTDFSTLFALLTTVEMTSFQQSIRGSKSSRGGQLSLHSPFRSAAKDCVFSKDNYFGLLFN